MLLAALSASSMPGAAQTAADPAEALARGKADAEARAAYWNAQKAAYDAEAAAAKARFGSLGELNPSTGATEVGPKGGEIEAETLAAVAAQHAADLIAERLGATGATIVLLPPSADIAQDAWHSFRARAMAVEQAPNAARCRSLLALESGGPPPEAALPAVAAAIEVGQQLFRSDLKVTGVELAPHQTLLLRSVGARLAKQPKMIVILPDARATHLLVSDNPAVKQMDRLARLLGCVERELDEARKAPKPAPATIAALEAERARNVQFVKDVTTAAEDGTVALVEAARQAALEQNLTGGAKVLRIEAHKVGGSLFTRKNLWTTLGMGRPFQISSGLVASFELTDPTTGALEAGGALACTSGFHGISAAHRQVNREISQAARPGVLCRPLA